MHAVIVACPPPWRLGWFDWPRHSYCWMVVLAWVVCALAHAWLIHRANQMHLAAKRLDVLARSGHWDAVIASPCAPRRPAIVAATSVLLIPATVGLVMWLTARPKPWDDADRWRMLWVLEERITALNLSASIAPVVALIVAVAWACFVADTLHVAGLRRAARIALQPVAASMAAPFRALDRSDERVCAWIEAPGPKQRDLIVASLMLVITGVVPLCIGAHECLARVVESAECRQRWYASQNTGCCVDPPSWCVDEVLNAGEGTLGAMSASGLAGAAASTLLIAAVLLGPSLTRKKRCGEAPEAATRWWIVGCCMGLALLLSVASLPYARENALPLEYQYPAQRSGFTSGFMSLDEEDGPDQVPDGPMVDVARGEIDGVTADLESVLREKRKLWIAINPGRERSFPGIVMLPCRPDATARQLSVAAAAALRAGYTTAVLVVTRHLRQDRPVLGEIDIELWSGIRVSIGDESGDIELDPSDYSTCEELMHKAATARRDGKRVRLLQGEGQDG